MTPWRNDIVTTTSCPVCNADFHPIRRQRYCTPACRQTAFRRRHQHVTALPTPAPTRPLTEATIYECGQCEQRYHAQQWCHDCNRPCTRVGPGGLCPHCGDPVALQDLQPGHTTTTSPPSHGRQNHNPNRPNKATTVDTESQVHDAH